MKGLTRRRGGCVLRVCNNQPTGRKAKCSPAFASPPTNEGDIAGSGSRAWRGPSRGFGIQACEGYSPRARIVSRGGLLVLHRRVSWSTHGRVGEQIDGSEGLPLCCWKEATSKKAPGSRNAGPVEGGVYDSGWAMRSRLCWNPLLALSMLSAWPLDTGPGSRIMSPPRGA